MSITPTILTPALYNYYQTIGFREHPVMADLRKDMDGLPQQNLQSAPEVAHFLGFLVSLMAPKQVLEIGTFMGYGTLAMALELTESGHIHTCDRDSQAMEHAKTYWHKADITGKITPHVGDAVETLGTFEEDSFDLAFIDANKRAYEAYYEKCLKLVKPGGLIILDNTLWKGEVAERAPSKQAQAIRDLNEKIHQDSRVSMVMIPMSDGVTLVRKR